MSTIVKLKTKAALVSQTQTKQTLDLLSKNLSGFSYSEYGETISIHYPPIDVFHHSGNLTLTWTGARYILSGDPYHCEAELNKLLALLQVGYNINTVENFYSVHKMTEVTTEKLDGGIIKMSGIIDEKELVPVEA